MIDEVIDMYLKTKRITDSDIIKNGNLHSLQNPLQMLESSVLEYRTSQNNTYLYSCTNPNISQMEVEFIRLKTWINELGDIKYKRELSQILFPIFSHLYLDTFYECNGQQLQSAMIFFKRHQSSFVSESLRDIMKDIGNICRKEEIENKPLVKAFRSAKCELKLSPISATLLKNYISNCEEPTILLNVLSSWFVMEDEDINIREDDDPAVCPESEIIMGPRIEDDISPNKLNFEETANSNSDSDVDNSDHRFDVNNPLQSWISNVKSLQDCLPKIGPLLLLEIRDSHSVSCSSVCYESKLLTIGNQNSEVKLLSFSKNSNIVSSDEATAIELDKHTNICNSMSDVAVLRGHCGSVSAVKLLRNPNLILSSSHDATLRAWKKEDSTCVAVYRGHNNSIWNFDVSALNMYVATVSQDKTARLWTLDKTYPLRLYVGHYSSVTCVKFHPNGLYIATGSTDKTIRLFSVIDAKIARLFLGHSGSVHCLSFSPDGKFLASGGDGNEIIVWDLAHGQQYLSISTDNQFVSDLSWNLDSSILSITFLSHSIFLLHILKKSKENQHELIGGYELPGHKLTSCQFLELNNLLAVGVV